MIGILNSSAIASNTYDKIQQDYKTDLEKMGINNKKEWIKIYPQLISSKIEPSSDIIALSFKWPNKNNSEPVMQIVIQEFKNTNLDIRRAVEINERKYIDEQIKDLSSQLNTIRVKIKNFKLDNNTVDAANEASELTKARVDLEKQAEILKTQISYNEKNIEIYLRKLDFLALRKH
ncbi:MAG: hypothetical protein MZU84_03740 [Sphingobacterium sp.]|nr:hypothetical protein [Sphingobacterium sp.]